MLEQELEDEDKTLFGCSSNPIKLKYLANILKILQGTSNAQILHPVLAPGKVSDSSLQSCMEKNIDSILNSTCKILVQSIRSIHEVKEYRYAFLSNCGFFSTAMFKMFKKKSCPLILTERILKSLETPLSLMDTSGHKQICTQHCQSDSWIPNLLFSTLSLHNSFNISHCL